VIPVNPGRTDVTGRVDQRVELLGDHTIRVEGDDRDLHDAVLVVQPGCFDVDDGDPVGITEEAFDAARGWWLGDGWRGQRSGNGSCPLDSIPPAHRRLLPRICIPTSCRHFSSSPDRAASPPRQQANAQQDYRAAATSRGGSENQYEPSTEVTVACNRSAAE
jgi:hypothetical protein